MPNMDNTTTVPGRILNKLREDGGRRAVARTYHTPPRVNLRAKATLKPQDRRTPCPLMTSAKLNELGRVGGLRLCLFLRVPLLFLVSKDSPPPKKNKTPLKPIQRPPKSPPIGKKKQKEKNTDHDIHDLGLSPPSCSLPPLFPRPGGWGAMLLA